MARRRVLLPAGALALALGLAAVVVAANDGDPEVGTAALAAEPTASSPGTPREATKSVRQDDCGPGQIAGASTGELDADALNADLPPRTPEKAVAQAYARSKDRRTKPPLHFELGERRGERSAMYVGRDADGRYRAQFTVRRGDRGRWLVSGSVVCGDLPSYYTPQPLQVFS